MGALLVALLGALLFASPSCASLTHAHVADGSPAARTVLQPGPTGAEGHPHPDPAHGFSCSPSDPAPSARSGTPLPAGAARPQAATGPAGSAGPAPPAGSGGPARARSARSTLAIVCRWRL
ncbi:hypothetical protein ACFWJT_36220 [Streptomyces sp. NPDC127069]|uniref:hypothetical protein n=1 Tax=Streptomyces sp. NPDC127069 TaxID=3347128 RepID=UPI00365D07ED